MLVTVLTGVLVVVAAAGAVLGGLVVGQRRAAAAADLAALAAAETLGPPAGGGSACDRARSVAAANGAALEECVVVGREVLVRAVVDVHGLGRTWVVQARARAGPAASRPGGLSFGGGPNP